MDGPVTERILDPLFADQRLWRGRRVRDGAAGAARGIPSGHPALDAALPDGGFPADALTEIYVPSVEPLTGAPAGRRADAPRGIGELALVLPALARLARGPRLIALVAPPAIPYAPALAAAGLDLGRLLVVEPRDARDTAWTLELALRDGAAAAVVGWLDHALVASLRRLQLAAEAGGCWGVLYRPWAARRAASPAALRLALAPAAGGLRVELLKCRGSSLRTTLQVPLADAFAPVGAPTVAPARSPIDR